MLTSWFRSTGLKPGEGFERKPRRNACPFSSPFTPLVSRHKQLKLSHLFLADTVEQQWRTPILSEMEDKVVLLDFWASSFAMRVRLALAEKGVKYEQREENLIDKSPLLLEMNPVHKLVHVLIHNGKPICESLIIVQYIDEVFNDISPLLPSDPYQRSQARFWADYVDKKIYSNRRRLWREKGEEQENAKKVLIEALKTLEEELGEKLYFGGETFGFVDVSLLPITTWFYTLEILGNFSIEPECPKIIAWVKRCMQKESVSKSLPDPHKVYSFVLQLKQRLGID